MYKIYSLDLIKNNHQQFIQECHNAHAIFNRFFPDQNSTWAYGKYNLFSITGQNLLFYKLFIELKTSIKDYVGDDRPLWFQSWINFHMPDEVLKRHNHDWPFHGYISIQPHCTRTVFDTYEIKNEIGNIYIGPGHNPHTVVVDHHFDAPRITIGFDVTDILAEAPLNTSLIPI